MAIQRFAAATVLAAAFCLPAVPAGAAGLPAAGDSARAYDGSAETAHQARGWAPSRDDEGYSDYGYAAPRGRDDRYDDDPRWAAPDDRQAESYPAGRRALGLDRVAQVCVSVVERERDRVNAVEGLARDANGWSVSGSLYDGSGFSCRIGSDGLLQDVHFGRERVPAPMTAAAVPTRPELEPETRPAALAAPIAPEPAAPVPSASAPPQGLAATPAAQDESAYRVAKLPPPPEIPQPAGFAAARELPPQGAEDAGFAARSPTAAAAAAAPQPSGPAAQAVSDDDSGPLPPADTSEAHAVDPDQAPVAANAGQANDDGRYNASQAPDFRQPV